MNFFSTSFIIVLILTYPISSFGQYSDDAKIVIRDIPPANENNGCIDVNQRIGPFVVNIISNNGIPGQSEGFPQMHLVAFISDLNNMIGEAPVIFPTSTEGGPLESFEVPLELNNLTYYYNFDCGRNIRGDNDINATIKLALVYYDQNGINLFSNNLEMVNSLWPGPGWGSHILIISKTYCCISGLETPSGFNLVSNNNSFSTGEFINKKFKLGNHDIDSNTSNFDFMIYPTNVHSFSKVLIKSNLDTKGYIKIYDLKMNIHKIIPFRFSKGECNQILDLSFLPSGLYLISISSPMGIKTLKINKL